MLDVLVHGPRVDKGVMIHNRHAVSNARLVDVGDIGDVIHVVIVVDVCDLGDVYACVRNVHVLDISRAGPIPGHKDLAWCKREPAYSGADSDRESSASDKRN